MAQKQYMRVWKESALGRGALFGADPFVEPGSPVKNTDFVYPRMLGDNPFTMREVPNTQIQRDWAGGNRPFLAHALTKTCTGELSTWLYPEQAAFWAYHLTLNATNGDLPSMVIDWAHQLEDDSATMVYERFVGVKIQTATFTASPESQEVLMRLTLVGQRKSSEVLDDETFPEPAFNSYPTGLPFVFADAANPGWVKFANTNRAEMNSLEFTVTNTLDAPPSETEYVQRIKHCGRDVTFQSSFVYTSLADRLAFESATALTTNSIKLDNGTNSVTFTLGKAVITGVDDALNLSNIARQQTTFTSLFDGTTDFSMVAA